jgi:hypothetical protein
LHSDEEYNAVEIDEGISINTSIGVIEEIDDDERIILI